MTGVFERFRDALFVTVTGFVFIAVILLVLGGLYRLLSRMRPVGISALLLLCSGGGLTANVRLIAHATGRESWVMYGFATFMATVCAVVLVGAASDLAIRAQDAFRERAKGAPGNALPFLQRVAGSVFTGRE